MNERTDRTKLYLEVGAPPKNESIIEEKSFKRFHYIFHLNN